MSSDMRPYPDSGAELSPITGYGRKPQAPRPPETAAGSADPAPQPSTAACAAASRAIGTLKGEQLT